MIVYTANKREFIQDVQSELIQEIIHVQFQRKLLRKASKSEVLSWQNSMQRMIPVLEDAEIPDDSGVHI